MTEASIGFLNYTDEIGPIGRASYFNKVKKIKDLVMFPLDHTMISLYLVFWDMKDKFMAYGRYGNLKLF